MPRGSNPNSRANLVHRRFKPIPPDVQRRIVSAYETVGIETIRRRFKLSSRRIRQVLKDNNVVMRPSGVNA